MTFIDQTGLETLDTGKMSSTDCYLGIPLVISAVGSALSAQLQLQLC